MTNEVILCVDDENMVLQCLKTELIHLFGRQFSIEIAESGPEALAIFKDLLTNQTEIPVVISDYIMPGMKGDELLQQIHRMSLHTCTILLTGQAKIEGITNAINYANLFYYLEKPWKGEELKKIIVQAMDQYRQNKILVEERSALSRDITALQAELDQKTLELDDTREALAGLGDREFQVPTASVLPSNLLPEEIHSSLMKIKSNIDSILGHNATVGPNASLVQSASGGHKMPEVGQAGFDTAAREELLRLSREELERITLMINQLKEGHQ